MDDKVKAIQERLRKQLTQKLDMSEESKKAPVISFEEIVGAPEGAENLVPAVTAELKRRGHRVANVRRFSVNSRAAKCERYADPYLEAGSELVLEAFPSGICMSKATEAEPSVDDIIEAVSGKCDIIVAEGFGYVAFPKILITEKPSEGFNLGLPNMVGYVSQKDMKALIPCFGVDEYERIADFIEWKILGIEPKPRETAEVAAEEEPAAETDAVENVSETPETEIPIV